MTKKLPDNDRSTVLITGAAGYLGGVLRAGLRGIVKLRLSDRLPLPTPLCASEEFYHAELEDMMALQTAMRDVDAVVHLGGISAEAPWETILPANIVGTYNVFETARRCGVRRVIYASSHHVTGFYRRDRKVGVDDPVRPDTRYAVSKVFGEALGRLYADKHGLSVICQRIGVSRPAPPHRRSLSNWLSERDYVELTRRCLDAPDVHFQIVYGVSASSTGFYDDGAAAALGFVSGDDADRYRADVLDRNPAPEPAVESLFQGGSFCSVEFDADADRID
ncbi:MAG TPA: NAD(P)-dependent oxidoreductase [Rhizomicrobium sp.]|nr:NAD(P)-dependent oxidoreductase [Rhizomicrobium sp.]